MPLSRAKLLRALLVRLGAPLSVVCACLPQDDLASHSRAWTSEPEALQPAPPSSAGDGGALPPGADAGELPGPPSASPGELLPRLDAGAPAPDAGEPLDAGPDAALEVVDASPPAAEEETPPPDAGSVGSDAGP